MVIIVCALGFGCYFTFTRWKELEALDSEQGAIWENAMTWRNIFIICVVSEVILTLLFIFCISRVRIAVEVISQASTAVWSNLSTLFFPVVTSVMIIVCIAYWAMVSLFLVASREATQCVGIGRKGQIFFGIVVKMGQTRAKTPIFIISAQKLNFSSQTAQNAKKILFDNYLQRIFSHVSRNLTQRFIHRRLLHRCRSRKRNLLQIFRLVRRIMVPPKPHSPPSNQPCPSTLVH